MSEPAVASQREFFLRRLHSLTGVVPLGGFLIEHLWTNAAATAGPQAFNHAVGGLQRLPGLLFLEVFGILSPLAFHAFYGIFVLSRSRINVDRYAYTRNWMFALQRLTGLFTFAFVLVHLWQYRIAKALGELAWPEFYRQLSLHMNHRGIYSFYVLGLSATVFHFTNGLYTAGQTWGVWASERGAKRAGYACIVLGLLLWLLGMNTLLHFAFRCGGIFRLRPAFDACGPLV